MRFLRLLLMTVFCALFATGAELDRIAVTVGRHVIADSDVLLELRIAAFLDGKPLAELSIDGVAKRKAAERLVDQYLILQDAITSRALMPDEAAVTKLIEPLQARYASPKEYSVALEQAGITEAELASHLLAGLRLFDYSEARFRSSIQVSAEDLRAYFATLVAQRKSGDPSPIPGFEASRAQLEQLLTNQRSSEALEAWLQSAREDAKIIYREAAFH